MVSDNVEVATAPGEWGGGEERRRCVSVSVTMMRGWCLTDGFQVVFFQGPFSTTFQHLPGREARAESELGRRGIR